MKCVLLIFCNIMWKNYEKGHNLLIFNLINGNIYIEEIYKKNNYSNQGRKENMKLQHLIMIFLIIMLPMALIMSQYTGLQIDTLSTKTKYDTALLGATFDTMAAFELNTLNSARSSVVGEEIRDLEAVISTFTTSLSTSLNISGASSDYILSYVPAMVFGLYDGYYIYAQNDTGTGRELKPYVYYTKTYSRNGTNITIAYSLDNYVSIYGTYNGKSISAAGYLVIPNDVVVSSDFAYVTTIDEDGGLIAKVLDPGTRAGGQKSWITYKGYDIYPETIYENKTFSDTEGMLIDRPRETTEAMMYYYEALQFTKLYNEVVSTLGLAEQQILLINEDNDPEDENSPFMNEKINVMQASITKNLNNAIYNYEGAVSTTYEMPQLNGEDWEKILNNISIIAFLKDIPIGATTYNNYVVINSTTNQKYNSSKAIDFIEYVNDKDTGTKSYGYYHKITCEDMIKDLESGLVSEIIGYASVDYERYKYTPEDSDEPYYYYKHNEYADYECEIERIENQNVATIEEYIKGKTVNNNVRNKILKSYYTSVGRIRYRLIKASSYINLDSERNFSIRYWTNGGNWSKGNPYTDTTTIGRLSTISETPSISGKVFMGWSRTQNATVAEVKTGDTIYVQTGKTMDLYAVYANQYTITYNNNGGVGGPTPNVATKVSGVDYTLSTVKPTKAEGVFLGWSTNPSATTAEYLPGDVYAKNENLYLYAIWTTQTIKIRYDTKGGSPVPTQEKAVGSTIKLQGTPMLVGSVFKGWSTTRNGTVPQYIPGSDYSENVDKTLYAIWDTQTYRITYSANGGELSADLQNTSKCIKPYGIGYFILMAKPTKSGHNFIGWSTDPNAIIGDANYAPGALYTGNADLTLYAVWEGESYSIVYDANGGKNEPGIQSAVKDRDITITNDRPSRDGYEFVGWSTDSLAKESEVQYRPGDSYKQRTSVKLYAIWKQGTYTITYNANGGSPTPETQVKKYGENIHITSTQPSKTDNYFVGWSTNSNSTNVEYYPNQVYRDNASITLYAVWSSGFYNIIYNLNGGTNGPIDQNDIRIGQAETISTITPTRTGYSFQGWSTNSTATVPDTNYAPGRTYSGPLSLELYAVWSADSQTMTVKPNGGYWQGSTGVSTFASSTNARIVIEKPIPPIGYEFLGWTLDSGDAYLNKIDDNNYEVIFGTTNASITAQYVEKSYQLIFNANTISAVSNMPMTQYYTYGSNATIPTALPTRSGYSFQGWSTSPIATSGDSTYAPGSTFTMPYNNINLYAIWKREERIYLTGNVWIPAQYVMNYGSGAFWDGSPEMHAYKIPQPIIYNGFSWQCTWPAESMVTYTSYYSGSIPLTDTTGNGDYLAEWAGTTGNGTFKIYRDT